MKSWLIGCCALIGLVSCSEGNRTGEAKEDLTAKELLQGIWLDDDTELPLMRIEGDTIYYSDPRNLPVAFKVIRDTMYVYGSLPAAYKIDRQTGTDFWFHSMADEIIKLHKSEEQEDSLAFSSREVEPIPTVPEVIQKDSVIMYEGRRFRGYVYINPSQMKVIRSSYTEDGISVDNVYYDNVIHICVYEGKELRYGKDITKKIFTGVIPEEWLAQSILSDMNFVKVNSDGYHYQAILRMPESMSYYLADLTIGFDKELHIMAVD